jgi:hypothetical protein
MKIFKEKSKRKSKFTLKINEKSKRKSKFKLKIKNKIKNPK